MEKEVLKCPYCGADAEKALPQTSILEGNFTTERQRPSEGAVCICIVCCNVSIYDENSNLVKISKNDLEDLKKEDPEFFSTLEKTKDKSIQMLRNYLDNNH